jgi:hypothetical protein
MGAGVGEFRGTYTLRRIGRGTYRYLPDPDDPLRFVRPDGLGSITLAREIETDLASVPRICWWVPGFAPADLERPALIHDAAYQCHHEGADWTDRATADRMLWEGCRAEGYHRLAAWLVWAGVRLFGGRVWREGL